MIAILFTAAWCQPHYYLSLGTGWLPIQVAGDSIWPEAGEIVLHCVRLPQRDWFAWCWSARAPVLPGRTAPRLCRVTVLRQRVQRLEWQLGAIVSVGPVVEGGGLVEISQLVVAVRRVQLVLTAS
jgi:hypothetical protein